MEVQSENSVGELLEYVGTQTVVGNIMVYEIDKEYHHQAVLEMWKYLNHDSEQEPDMKFYSMILPYFKIIINSTKNITLHIVPNKRHQYAFLLIKVDHNIYGIDVKNDDITNTLIDNYVKCGLSGNLIAVYFSEG